MSGEYREYMSYRGYIEIGCDMWGYIGIVRDILLQRLYRVYVRERV